MHHGELYLRDYVTPRSHYHDQGRFGRLFPQLDPFFRTSAKLEVLRDTLFKLGAPNGPLDPQDPLIDNIAGALATSPTNKPNNINPGMSVGFTFLGQFLDHDITFDPTSSLERQIDLESIANFRTPRFELDSVYGSGRAASPPLYDKNARSKFLIEKLSTVGGAKDDLPRNSQSIAIIGDPRNDENVMISQLHLGFLKFHNKVDDLLIAKGWANDGERFAEAQKLVRWHYQWIILNQFLPVTCGADLVEDILENGPRFYTWRNEPFIPVEFSVAAYRFGHSQVRPGYVPNPGLGAAIFDLRPGKPDLRGGKRGPERFVNWNVFFDFSDGQVKDNMLIDTKISTPLFKLPFGAPGTPVPGDVPETLAGRNLLRHVTFSLPSGQDVARAMDEKPLAESEFSQDIRNFYAALPAPKFDFLKSTPLWLYILQEAETREGGARLGPVGGRIVAEVFIGLLQGDPKSYGCRSNRTTRLSSYVNELWWMGYGKRGRSVVCMGYDTTYVPIGGPHGRSIHRHSEFGRVQCGA